METKFRNKVISLIKENFSPFEFATLFNLDKGNACAYLRGSKKNTTLVMLLRIGVFRS